MLSAYVEVLLCVIELLAFVAFKNTTLPDAKWQDKTLGKSALLHARLSSIHTHEIQLRQA